MSRSGRDPPWTRRRSPIRLVMAAAFAYAAKLPMYVFHSEAGVHGKTRFEDTPAIDRFGHVLRLLPGDLSDWRRNDGKGEDAPFTAFAEGQPDRYWPEVESVAGRVRAEHGEPEGRPVRLRPDRDPARRPPASGAAGPRVHRPRSAHR